MDFYDLDLNDNTLDALDDMNFTTCTPVQEKCIPEILAGKDVLGVAQTGTGKTAAYLLPIISMLDDGCFDFGEDRKGQFPNDAINCVIMSPTRELAQQIDQAMQGFSYYMPEVSSVAVYGGNDGNRYDQEFKSMKMGADVIIATPGRLRSHIKMGNVDLSRVSFFVLDEADRMLDMGFSDDILAIAKLLPANCQIILFSATMPGKIEELARTLMKSPSIVKLAVSKPAEKIRQAAYVCHENQKLRILHSLFKNDELVRVIIFSSSKLKVKEINRELRMMKINCDEMHSDLSQAERDDVMYRFKSGQVDVLVATDIVARGIDIDDIATVINYDVPRDAEDYVHRIGRTARADRDGKAITLVRGWEIKDFMMIERFLEKTVEKLPLPDGMTGPEYKAMNKKGGRAVFHQRGKGKNDHKGLSGKYKKKNNNRQKDRRAQSSQSHQPQEQIGSPQESQTKKPKRQKKNPKRASNKDAGSE